jgi:hypothetical protein
MSATPLFDPTGELQDKRAGLLKKFLALGLGEYDIIQRLSKAGGFPETFTYFQKRTLVREEIKRFQEEERVRLKAEDKSPEDHQLDHIARLEFMYERAIQSNDLANARVLSKELARARGVSVDEGANSEAGLAAILRMAAKQGRENFERMLASPQQTIDITPSEHSAVETSLPLAQEEQESAPEPANLPGIMLTPSAQRALHIVKPFQSSPASEKGEQ